MAEPEKKTKQKAKPKTPTAPTKPSQKDESEQPVADDDFDFGGLPKRDLKKNLGCG